MRIVDHNSPKSHIFLSMWILHMGYRVQDVNALTKKGFISIVQAFNNFFDEDSDIYWLAKKFYDNVLKFEAEIPKLVERSQSLLEKEDGVYFKALKEKSLLDKVLLAKWVDCCFAGVLNENALAK